MDRAARYGGCVVDSLPRFDETGALPAFEVADLSGSNLEPIEDSTPRSIAPIALDASDLEDEIEEVSISQVLEEEPRARWRSFALAAVVLLVIAGIPTALRGGERRTFLAASIDPPPPAIATAAPAPPAPAPPPPIVLAPVQPKVKTTGTIVTPLWARGRRVWVDGKVVTGHAPKVDVACGKHLVRIGAYAKAKQVDIPCGGELKLAP